MNFLATLRGIRSDTRAQVNPIGWIWLLAGVPGLIGVGIWDIFRQGSVTEGSTTGGLFGYAPSFLGTVVSFGVILIIFAIIGLILWLLLRRTRVVQTILPARQT
jgi:hypothetical protein